jgi:hypothetical protein
MGVFATKLNGDMYWTHGDVIWRKTADGHDRLQSLWRPASFEDIKLAISNIYILLVQGKVPPDLFDNTVECLATIQDIVNSSKQHNPSTALQFLTIIYNAFAKINDNDVQDIEWQPLPINMTQTKMLAVPITLQNSIWAFFAIIILPAASNLQTGDMQNLSLLIPVLHPDACQTPPPLTKWMPNSKQIRLAQTTQRIAQETAEFLSIYHPTTPLITHIFDEELENPLF